MNEATFISLAVSVVLGLVAAIGVLWRKLGKIETQRDDLYRRLILEIGRGADLATLPQRAEDPPPEELPSPDWDEPTDIRQMRKVIEKQKLDSKLRRYVESTPPGGYDPPAHPRKRMPSHKG